MVSLPVFRQQRPAIATDHYRLHDGADYRELRYHCADCHPVRATSVPSSMPVLFSLRERIELTAQSDRTKYFHYMWDPLPEDGSVKCQDPSVQTTVGFVQGGKISPLPHTVIMQANIYLFAGFNTIIDFFLAVTATFELWQFFLQTLKRNPDVSAWSQFRRLNSSVWSRRIWQTVTLSGPLVLSGIASIVKTYVC